MRTPLPLPPGVRAMWHVWRTRHQLWSDEMNWPGGSGTVWFCDCGEEFWPRDEGVPDWRTSPVRRERPEERPK